MQKRFRRPPRTRTEQAELQEYLAQFTDAQLKAVGRRVQSDLMLRRARTVERKDFEERPGVDQGVRARKIERHRARERR